MKHSITLPRIRFVGSRSSHNFPYSQPKRPEPSTECFIQISQLHPIQFHLLFRTSCASCCCCRCCSHVVYDEWNKRFWSRRQLLRVVDIKKSEEEFPFYYRAKAGRKFKSFASENSDVVWRKARRKLQKQLAFGMEFSVIHKQATTQMV